MVGTDDSSSISKAFNPETGCARLAAAAIVLRLTRSLRQGPHWSEIRCSGRPAGGGCHGHSSLPQFGDVAEVPGRVRPTNFGARAAAAAAGIEGLAPRP